MERGLTLAREWVDGALARVAIYATGIDGLRCDVQAAGNGAGMQADRIITNARVLTMDPNLPRAEAVAMSAGRILAVGDRRSVEALAGPQTDVIDASRF